MWEVGKHLVILNMQTETIKTTKVLVFIKATCLGLCVALINTRNLSCVEGFSLYVYYMKTPQDVYFIDLSTLLKIENMAMCRRRTGV
jgi:hypothetical protein